MEQLPANCLTTVQRVKDRLKITDTAYDVLIGRYIVQMTGFIENRTNRKFLRQTYTAEEYSVYGQDQSYLLLNQSPVFVLVGTGTTTNGSTSITNVSNIIGVAANMPIVGENILPGTKIVSATGTAGAATVVITQAATGSKTGGTFKITGLTDLQYRLGLPSNPNWTSFIQDQYELLENGESGLVRVYGPLAIAKYINNSVRATYTAGYLIDFDHAGDTDYHTLPAELTFLCENLVVRMYKRREVAGKTSEGIQGSSISWNPKLDAEDEALILQFSRTPRFF